MSWRDHEIKHVERDVFEVDGINFGLDQLDIFSINDEEEAIVILELLRRYRYAEPPLATPDRWPVIEAKIGRLARRIKNKWPEPETVHANRLKHILNRENQWIGMLESLADKIIESPSVSDGVKAVARGHLKTIRNTQRTA